MISQGSYSSEKAASVQAFSKSSEAHAVYARVTNAAIQSRTTEKITFLIVCPASQYISQGNAQFDEQQLLAAYTNRYTNGIHTQGHIPEWTRVINVTYQTETSLIRHCCSTSPIADYQLQVPLIKCLTAHHQRIGRNKAVLICRYLST